MPDAGQGQAQVHCKRIRGNIIKDLWSSLFEMPGIRLAEAQHTLTSQACRTMKVWSRQPVLEGAAQAAGNCVITRHGQHALQLPADTAE